MNIELGNITFKEVNVNSVKRERRVDYIRKKALVAVLAIAMISAVFLLPANAVVTGMQYNTLYMTKQMIPVGAIETFVDGANLHVRLILIATSGLVETHLAVAPKDSTPDGVPPPGIPVTNSGNPKVGNFPYAHSNLANAMTDEYVIPLTSLDATSGEVIAIALHAVVNTQQGQETAWGNCGEPKGHFQGNNWAVFYYYTLP